MNIALLSQSFNSYSETFIQNHKKNLPGNVYYYFGGHIPGNLEGVGKLEELYYQNPLHLFKKKILKTGVSGQSLLKYALKKNKTDLIFAEFGHVGAKAYPIAKALQIPLISTWLGYEISNKEVLKKNRDLYRSMLSDASTKHIVVSKTMIPKLLELGAKEETVFYSPLPPDEIFADCTPDFAANHLLAVGRFVEKKAPQNLVLAMKKVVEKFPDAVLTIVGEGPLLNQCQEMVKEFSLEQNVHFAGVKNLEEIKTLMNASSVFVQHSVTAPSGDSEGTPVVILEASFAGLPVVSTLHSGIPDVILNGETGFLVKENDVQDFAEKIITLLSDKALAKSMGENGRSFVRDNFSLEKHLETLKNIINSQLQK